MCISVTMHIYITINKFQLSKSQVDFKIGAIDAPSTSLILLAKGGGASPAFPGEDRGR